MNAFRSWLARVLDWQSEVLHDASVRLRGYDPAAMRAKFEADLAKAQTGDPQAARDFLFLLGGEGD
jgi:hypothetical protein